MVESILTPPSAERARPRARSGGGVQMRPIGFQFSFVESPAAHFFHVGVSETLKMLSPSYSLRVFAGFSSSLAEPAEIVPLRTRQRLEVRYFFHTFDECFE